MSIGHLQVIIGAEHYALDVTLVREVAELGDVTPVPGAGPHVAGVQSLRGELLPVIRPQALLGVAAGEPRRLVVIDHAGRRAGLAVDRARDVSKLEPTDEAAGPLTRGAVLHDGELVGIVDIPALLDAVTGSGA
ncbi:MAG: CheW protein [Solirubrobacterales bacterium]|nr:CheW protein [Solirubrobacterales bacterium]